MLGNLFDFTYQRNAKEAIGFYFAVLFILLVIDVVLFDFYVPKDLALSIDQLLEMTVQYQENNGPKWLSDYFFYGALVKLIVGAFLSVMIALKKNIFKSTKGLVIVLGAIISTYFFPLLGLGLIAWLTTQPAEEELVSEEAESEDSTEESSGEGASDSAAPDGDLKAPSDESSNQDEENKT